MTGRVEPPSPGGHRESISRQVMIEEAIHKSKKQRERTQTNETRQDKTRQQGRHAPTNTAIKNNIKNRREDNTSPPCWKRGGDSSLILNKVSYSVVDKYFP